MSHNDGSHLHGDRNTSQNLLPNNHSNIMNSHTAQKTSPQFNKIKRKVYMSMSRPRGVDRGNASNINEQSAGRSNFRDRRSLSRHDLSMQSGRQISKDASRQSLNRSTNMGNVTNNYGNQGRAQYRVNPSFQNSYHVGHSLNESTTTNKMQNRHRSVHQKNDTMQGIPNPYFESQLHHLESNQHFQKYYK